VEAVWVLVGFQFLYILGKGHQSDAQDMYISGYEHELCTLQNIHKLQDMGQNSVVVGKPNDLDIHCFEHILADNLGDFRHTMVNKCKLHYLQHSCIEQTAHMVKGSKDLV
jgi:hypothetical protein